MPENEALDLAFLLIGALQVVTILCGHERINVIFSNVLPLVFSTLVSQLEQFRQKEFKGELAAEREGGELFEPSLVQVRRLLMLR